MTFNFLGYCDAIEKTMQLWYEHNRQVLAHAGNLGYAREHFVKEILVNFLPKSVIVGSGEIIDSFGRRSGQQDVIIYRSDFPVITSLTPVNTYLIEGVIATIEVKSNLSTGNPIGLVSALKNIAKVKLLVNHAPPIHGTEEEIRNLQKKHTVKTYVIAYDGWASESATIENYVNAINEVRTEPPDLVYQPIGCVVNPSLFPDMYRKNNQTEQLEKIAVDESMRYFCSIYPFAIFFQSILRTVMLRMDSLLVTDSQNGATMKYSLNGYFSLPEIPLGAGIKFLQK